MVREEDEATDNMSGDPVGDDELHREQKQQQEDGGGVEKEKILSPLPEDDEHEQPNGESDVLLLTKEKSFVFEERIKDANLLKMRGNERLRNNELVEAEKNYRRGLFHVDMDPMQETFELMDKHRSILYKARQPIKLNLCQCILRQDTKRASEVLQLAYEVIEKNPECAKAWFWKGNARMEMGNFIGAKEDLLIAAKHSPQDRQIRLTLQGVKEKIREEDKITKSTWLDLFQKHPMASSPSPSSSQSVGRAWPEITTLTLAVCVAVMAIWISLSYM